MPFILRQSTSRASEFVGIDVGQLVGEFQANHAAHAGFVQQADLLFRGNDFIDGAVRIHHFGGVVAEGDDGGDQRGSGQLEHAPEQVGVALVDSVENPDGDDGATARRRRGFGKGLAKATTAKSPGSRVFRIGHCCWIAANRMNGRSAGRS